MACGALEQLLEPLLGGVRQLERAKDGGAGARPVGAGDQEALGIGVAAAALHPDLAGAQRTAQLAEQAQLPVVAVDPAVGQIHVRPPAARDEPDRSVVGHAPRAAAVEVAQLLHGGEKRLAVGVGAQSQRREDPRREVACGTIALTELLDVVVLKLALALGRERQRELKLLRGRALPDGMADLPIGYLRIQEDFEQLTEQHDRGVRAVGDVELELDQRATGLGVLDADTVVEQVDDLVGHARRGLGAERQQRRMAKRPVATADRLAGRVADVLGEHPAPVRRDHLQIPSLGPEAAK